MLNKSDFKLIFLILGSFIGGGFASGKEILVYFSKFGYVSLVFCMLFGVVLWFFLKEFLMIGHAQTKVFCYQIKVFKMPLKFKFVLIFSNMIITGSMLAGIFELGNSMLNNCGIYFLISTIIILICVLRKGISGLENMNMILVPLLITAILSVVFFSFGNYESGLILNNIVSSFFSSIVYTFFNILAMSLFLIEVGKSYTYKQIKKCSVISSITLTLILLIINVFFITYYNTMQNFNLPMVILATNLSKWAGYIVIAMVYVGMLTTLLSTSYTIKQFFNTKFNNFFSISFTIIIGVIISLFGFELIVSKFYIFLGLFGIVYCVYVVGAKRKNFALKN